MKAYRIIAVVGVGLLAACADRAKEVLQPAVTEASGSAAFSQTGPSQDYLRKLGPRVRNGGQVLAVPGGLMKNLGGTVLTETFDNPLGGWKTRWLGLNSNLRNYYIQYGCWSGEPGEDCRGNNWDGLWIADDDNSSNSSFIRFNAAFAATITSFSIDIGSHMTSTLIVYDKNLNVILTETIPLGCSNCSYFNPGGNVYSHHSVSSSNGIGGWDILFGEGNIGIDNVSVTVGPTDDTPPVITPTVTGTLGDNGWYTSDVDVSWTVTDPETPFTSTGCEASSVTANTSGVTFTCSATSDGGTSSSSVTVKRDADAPVITFSGNLGAYTVDETVAITCSASDAPAGVASTSCPGAASGPAYSFSLGTNSASASASDNAGNSGTASTSFSVSVTYGSLCALTRSFVSNAGIANALCQKLDAAAASAERGSTNSKTGQIGAYINQLEAQSGKAISAANAAILIALAGAL